MKKKLPDRTGYFFDQLSAGRLFDWKQFYRFIHAAHQGRLKWDDTQIKGLLSEKGFDAEHSAELARIYKHGRALLKARPALNDIKLRASGFKPEKGWREIMSQSPSQPD